MQQEYYIYYHIDPRDSLPKYVGKGSGNRAWQFCGRNKKHKKWLEELRNEGLTPTVEVGNFFKSEDEAYKVEKIEISLLKKLSCILTNIAPGGSGYPRGLAEKAIICTNNKTTYCSTKFAADSLNIQPKRICDVLKGRKKSYKGYQFKYEDEELNITPDKLRKQKSIFKAHTTAKPVMCNETGKAYISITEAAKDIRVTNSAIVAHLNKRTNGTIKSFTFRRI